MLLLFYNVSIFNCVTKKYVCQKCKYSTDVVVYSRYGITIIIYHGTYSRRTRNIHYYNARRIHKSKMIDV